jgi:hypothetical protein
VLEHFEAASENIDCNESVLAGLAIPC